MLAVVAVMVLLAFRPGSVEAGQTYRLLRLDGGYLKWGTAELGTGAVVTYALVSAPRHDAGARNCGELTPLGPALRVAGIAMSGFVAELRAAFAMWQAVADIRFVPAEDNDSAQILIGAQAVPRGRAWANVDFAETTAGSTHRMQRALICLSPAAPWKVGFGGDPLAYDLRYVLAHEIGHAIGLDHPGASGHLMGFRYTEARRGLSAGDATGAVILYGPPAPIAAAAAQQTERAAPVRN